MFTIEVSREQRLLVDRTLTDGSNPRPAFFFMATLSALIASLGLIMDSTAIVIGAMLVAPLMTPILGTSLAMVRRDPVLLGRAVRAEIAGVCISIGSALLLGLAVPYFEATPEMLSRTQPNLFDLAVALLAGLAGAYALVDERLSPALPGVAISTAIVPPLANAGLSASLGAYQGAWGSFLLFLTNFISILLAAGLVFLVSGFGRQPGLQPTSRLAVLGRFGITTVALLGMAAFLALELGELIERRLVRNEVRQTLSAELPRYRVSEILSLHTDIGDDKIVVMAHVLGPLVVRPHAIKTLERALEADHERDFRLFIRTSITVSASASGAMRKDVAQTLDGFTIGEITTEAAEMMRAEQALREYLDTKVGIRLERIEMGFLDRLLVETTGLRNLRHAEVVEMDALLQRVLGEGAPRIALLQNKREILSRQGLVRWELTMRRDPTPEERKRIEALREVSAKQLAARSNALVSSTFTPLEDGWHGFLEVAGPGSLGPMDVRAMEDEIRRRLGFPCDLLVRSVPESVVSSQGYTSWDAVLADYGRRTRDHFSNETQEILQEWR